MKTNARNTKPNRNANILLWKGNNFFYNSMKVPKIINIKHIMVSPKNHIEKKLNVIWPI